MLVHNVDIINDILSWRRSRPKLIAKTEKEKASYKRSIILGGENKV